MIVEVEIIDKCFNCKTGEFKRLSNASWKCKNCGGIWGTDDISKIDFKNLLK